MPKPTIVLVHGAWADGASWNAVSTALQGQGFTVLTPPNLLHGVAGDAAYVASFLAQRTTGPVVLAGHSYGGVVITNAGTAGGEPVRMRDVLSRVTNCRYVIPAAAVMRAEPGRARSGGTGTPPGSAVPADTTTADLVTADMTTTTESSTTAAPETATIVKQMMGFNFLPQALGQQIQDSVLELIRSKKVRTVIGRQSPFEELPQAIAAMGQRDTTGRVIITL